MSHSSSNRGTISVRGSGGLSNDRVSLALQGTASHLSPESSVRFLPETTKRTGWEGITSIRHGVSSPCLSLSTSPLSPRSTPSTPPMLPTASTPSLSKSPASPVLNALQNEDAKKLKETLSAPAISGSSTLIVDTEPYQSPYQTLGYDKARPITVQYSLPRQPYQPFQAIPPLLVGRLSGSSTESGVFGSDSTPGGESSVDATGTANDASMVLPRQTDSRGSLIVPRETQLSRFTSSVMGKIYEISDMTLLLASTKFEKMLSKREEEPAAPPNSFVALPPDPILHITHFSRAELEHLYYDFRSKSVRGEEYPVGRENLYLLIHDIRFPPSSSILQFIHVAILSSVHVSKEIHKLPESYTNSIWDSRFDDEDAIHFAEYALFLSIISRGSCEERLRLIFKMCCSWTAKGVTNKVLLKREEMASLATLLRTDLPQLHQPHIESILDCLFTSDGSPISSANGITYEGLVANSESLNSRLKADLFDCFGLFAYIYCLTLQRTERLLRDTSMWRPEKEGFLTKSWSLESSTNLFEKWKKHWCVLKNGFLYYYQQGDSPQKNGAERVINVEYGQVKEITNQNQRRYCFQLDVPNYGSRKFECEDPSDLDSWMTAIKRSSRLHSLLPLAPGVERTFESFASLRHNVTAEWYVDGKSTFKAIYKAILSAQQQIFITDWFLSPELYLIREDECGWPDLRDDYRLDRLLKLKAEQGVKIYVLLWNETKIAVELNSLYSKTQLEKLSTPNGTNTATETPVDPTVTNNIKVIRHPVAFPVKWSHHQKTVVIDQKFAFVGGLDLCYGRYDDEKHELIDSGLVHVWKGKDYYNPMYMGFTDVDKPFVDSVDRHEIHRMPWHDVHMSVDGQAARDVAYNFIQRWNHHKEAIQSPYEYLTPCSSFLPPTGKQSCQLLRSMSDWSGGIGAKNIENSIYEAYLHLISTAKHYIYIENQYFISSMANRGNTKIVFNDIAEAIFERVKKAILQRETFRCILVIPCYPDGTFKEDSSIRYIMKLQFETITRGGNSILEKLRKEFPDCSVEDYICFCSLRTFNFVGDRTVTEQIYVHSKLLIVDDEVCIIGTANINDRSMLGDRDSEIAVLVRDTNLIESTMNDEPYMAAKFAHSLRCHLWGEHLGEKDLSILSDPTSDRTYYGKWLVTAKKNSTIYREVFGAKKTSTDPSSIIDNTDISRMKAELVQEMVGHLVMFDRDFLADSSLMPSKTDLNLLFASTDIFT